MKIILFALTFLLASTSFASQPWTLATCKLVSPLADLRLPSSMEIVDVGPSYDYVLKTYDNVGNVLAVYQIPDISGYTMSWYLTYLQKGQYVDLKLRALKGGAQSDIMFMPSPGKNQEGSAQFDVKINNELQWGAFACAPTTAL